MKQGGGKQKGAAFERKICQQLSLWVSDGEAKDLFWRSAMSGGRATVARKRGQKLARQAGDVTAIAPEGHQLTEQFYIELKHVANLALARFLLEGTGKLAEFWRTACVEADAYSKSPLLIAKQNRYPTLVMVRRDDFSLLVQGTLRMRRITFRRYVSTSELCLFDDMIGKKWMKFDD